MSVPDKYELLAEIARRRGFFWSSFEIYGGVGGFIDFGPLGTSLRRNIEERWRDFFVRKQGFLEISTPVITPAKVFEASGHVEHFKDPMVECRACGRRFRADHLLKEALQVETESLTLEQIAQTMLEKQIRCQECGGELSEPRYFGTMFKTTIGPYSEAVGYARPEAAQGMFINFKRTYEIARERFPFAVAQIGTALRNEISPRQGPIRLREFRIMEFELFYDPENPRCPRLSEVEEEALRIVPLQFRMKGVEEPVTITVREALDASYILTEWSAYFMALSKHFVTMLGIPAEKQRFHEKLPKERAHYSAQTYDHEVLLERWGWVEVAGHACRTDYDLTSQMKSSGVDMNVFKPYAHARKQEEAKVAPILSKLGPIFKSDAQRVAGLIGEADPEEVSKMMEEIGHYQVGPYKILPEYVKIEVKEAKETGRRFIPYVVEPSFGAERLVYATLEYAYERVEDRVVMRIPRILTPIQAVVLPLVNRDGLQEKAMEIHRDLLNSSFDAEYDDAGSIGRRYARADEIGVPVAVTIDYQTLRDDTVTLRDRDTWKQVRTGIADLPSDLKRYFSENLPLESLGTPFRSNMQA